MFSLAQRSTLPSPAPSPIMVYKVYTVSLRASRQISRCASKNQPGDGISHPGAPRQCQSVLQLSALSSVLQCAKHYLQKLTCWSALPYSDAQVYSVLLQSTSAINSLVCLCLCCAVNICYMLTSCQPCVLPGFSLPVMEKRTANDAIGLRRREFMWYFSLPSTSMSSVYLWYSLSVMYRVRLALRGSHQLRLIGQVIADL